MVVYPQKETRLLAMVHSPPQRKMGLDYSGSSLNLLVWRGSLCLQLNQTSLERGWGRVGTRKILPLGGISEGMALLIIPISLVHDSNRVNTNLVKKQG